MIRILLLGIILIGSMRCAFADGVDDVRAAVAAMKQGDLKGAVEHYTHAIESGDLSKSQIAEKRSPISTQRSKRTQIIQNFGVTAV